MVPDAPSPRAARSDDRSEPSTPLDPEVALFRAQLRRSRRRTTLLVGAGAVVLVLWALALNVGGDRRQGASPEPKTVAGLPAEDEPESLATARPEAAGIPAPAPARAMRARRGDAQPPSARGDARHIGRAVRIADLAGPSGGAPAPSGLEEIVQAAPKVPPVDPRALARSLADQKKGAVQLCFDSELKRDPLVHGALTVVIELRAPHELARVEVRDTLRRRRFTRCVAEALQGLEFPLLAEDLTIELPFRLKNPEL